MNENIMMGNCHQIGKKGITVNLIIAVFTIAIDSSFTYGYNLSNVYGMQHILKSWFNEVSQRNVTRYREKTNFTRSDSKALDVHTIFYPDRLHQLDLTLRAGGLIGSLYSMKAIKHFGRKGGLLMTSFINIFSVLFSGYAKYFDEAVLLFIGRLLFGIKSGMALVIASIYILEIVPVNYRPQFSVFYTMIGTIGAFIGNIVSRNLGTKDYWPLVISLSIIATVVQLFILPLCPESPKYLYVMKGSEIECRKALKWLQGGFSDEELFALRKEFCQRRMIGEITVKTLLDNKILRHALFVSIMLLVSKQLCGIEDAMHYFRTFTEKAVGFRFFVLIASKVAAITVINMFPRRTLLIMTHISMSFSCLLVSILLGLEISYSNKMTGEPKTLHMLIMITLASHIVSYSIGIGSLGWLMPGELFTTAFVQYPYALGIMSGWLGRMFTIIFYGALQQYMGHLNFANMCFINLIYAYYAYTRIPETRRKTVKEIYLSIYDDFRKKGVLL